MRSEPRDGRGCVPILPRPFEQSLPSGPSLVFSVGEREQLPAFALKECDSGVPDRLGTTEHHLFAALFAEKDNLPRRTDYVYPLRIFVPSREAHSHTCSVGTR